MGVLAAALRRHGRNGAFEDLQQRLLHTLAADVTGDRRVLALAGNLVDLVDVDDASLGLLDVEIGRLNQLEQNVFDVFTDVAGLGERGCVGHCERHVEHSGQGLGEVRLAATGGAEQQDVALRQLDVVAPTNASRLLMLDAPVVVVDGDREDLLGVNLADDVLVEKRTDLAWRWQLVEVQLTGFGELFFDDLVAQVDALVADVDTWTSDELLYLLLRFAAEGAFQ